MKILILIFLSYFSCANASYQVPLNYKKVANYYDIPADVFYALSIVESGKMQNGQKYPWAWTLNIESNAFYYENREDAFNALVSAILHDKQVDIGYMQVSWNYHRDIFRNAWDALDPALNLKAGALIFANELKKSGGNIDIAIGHYHTGSSNTIERKNRAKKYRQVVKNFLLKIKKAKS